MCTLSLLVFSQKASTQTTALKLNTSFLLGIRQVGGFAFEYCPDSSSWSYGLGLEFGNFETRQIGTISSQIDTRTVVGVGLSPHLRVYPLSGKRPAPHGFFLEGNVRLRFVRETDVTGIVISPIGYDLDDARMLSENKWLGDLSFACGFKTGQGKRDLEFEFLGGIGHTPMNKETFYRLELFISGIFNRKSQLGEDFFW